MSVPLLMGWALLVLLVLLVVGLVVVTVIAGGSGNPAGDATSPGQGVPVNVFQRGVAAPMLAIPVPAYGPPPAGQPDPGGPWAAPQPGGAPGLRRWHPGMGAAQAPMEAQGPLVAQAPVVAPGPTVGQPGLTRSPIVVWLLLPLVTFGIYSLVWYFKINRELRDFHPSIEVNPGLAVLAMFVPVASLVSVYHTGQRIAQAQQLTGLDSPCSGGLGVAAFFVLGLHPVYYQSQLNRLWAQQQA